jgi:hypothetical protein
MQLDVLYGSNLAEKKVCLFFILRNNKLDIIEECEYETSVRISQIVAIKHLKMMPYYINEFYKAEIIKENKKSSCDYTPFPCLRYIIKKNKNLDEFIKNFCYLFESKKAYE